MANKRKSSSASLAPSSSSKSKKTDPVVGRSSNNADEDNDCYFLGEPIAEEEAISRWPHRYKQKVGDRVTTSRSAEDDELKQAKAHYTRAIVDSENVFNLYDNAYVQAGEGEPNYICKIIEMFEGDDNSLNFTAQWYYRANDTVIKNHSNLIDDKRVFISEVKNDNTLNCLVNKLVILHVPLSATSEARELECDYYYDMKYLLPYSTFIKVPVEETEAGSDSSIVSCENVNGENDSKRYSDVAAPPEKKEKLLVLDLYSGCGAMSTGLCLGAKLAGLSVVTRWAVDINVYACESLKHNHPETEVRNVAAEDFLSLLKEWKKLCVSFSLISGNREEGYPHLAVEDEAESDDDDSEDGASLNDSEIFEVEKILDICYGNPEKQEKTELYLKVRWRGYTEEHDSWEPLDGLSNCHKSIKDFVVNGFNSNLLPLPGNADVVCGGPPCQGISGFNRFRNKDDPLADPKNAQLTVFMSIVDYLKPKFVLMENVVDLVKFKDGFLGRYALGRLIQMNYQTRMGIMAAGCYGLPQFRLRVFMWGALPTMTLPQYPLPSHDVVVRGVIPLEFEINTVAYNVGEKPKLEKMLDLKDAISDLPPVSNYNGRDQMPYGNPPESEFQHFIRLKKEVVGTSAAATSAKPFLETLFDHRPLQLNKDDYERVCCIPKEKGANFRNLPGVLVAPDNKVYLDPNMKRVLLVSGKPLVPDYAISFVNGTSSKPFGRLWWDETVPTVVTRAEPHNQVILHPTQDRVLTIRENARLQGFPDYYQLFGPVKERYIQVGNAVAVPVGRALGYALALAYQGLATDEPLLTLPPKFPKTYAASGSSSPALSQES